MRIKIYRSHAGAIHIDARVYSRTTYRCVHGENKITKVYSPIIHRSFSLYSSYIDCLSFWEHTCIALRDLPRQQLLSLYNNGPLLCQYPSEKKKKASAMSAGMIGYLL